jgi:hypothetical protein
VADGDTPLKRDCADLAERFCGGDKASGGTAQPPLLSLVCSVSHACVCICVCVCVCVCVCFCVCVSMCLCLSRSLTHTHTHTFATSEAALEMEGILGFYARSRGVEYDSALGWAELLAPFMAVPLSRGDRYNCFYVLMSKCEDPPLFVNSDAVVNIPLCFARISLVLETMGRILPTIWDTCGLCVLSTYWDTGGLCVLSTYWDTGGLCVLSTYWDTGGLCVLSTYWDTGGLCVLSTYWDTCGLCVLPKKCNFCIFIFRNTAIFTFFFHTHSFTFTWS